MIRHMVMFELLEQAEGKSRVENAHTVQQALASMAPLCDAQRFEVTLNEKRDALSKEIDVMLLAEFDSWEKLANYHNHPQFKQVIATVRPLRKNRWAVDSVV
ncbi:Dabb family protein [Magnetococcus sp. PR-3]|uniref:Dabb family protein n=1 Tax=Magnetococcus sp. PR-3 TaxID=3120355 RepID=UPI002FCDFF98